MLAALFARIEAQREALVELTRELVQIPTVNPPGDAYEVCARHLGERLRRVGFETTYVRAEGAIGDSDRYPRINLIARREGRGPGACVHFNGHIDVVEPGAGWSLNPFAGAVRAGRLYGRGAADMKGGIAAAVVALESILAEGIAFAGALEVSATADEEFGRLRRGRLSRRARLVLGPPGRPRDHPRAAGRGSHLHRPPRRLVGRDRDAGQGRPWLDAVPRRLRDPPHGGLPQPGRAPADAEAREPADGDAGGAARGAPADPEPERDPWRPGGGSWRACRARWSPTAAAW